MTATSSATEPVGAGPEGGRLSILTGRIPLPVLVFDSNMQLRARTIGGGEPILLPEGLYYLIVTQLAGGTITRAISIRTGDNLTLEFLSGETEAPQPDSAPRGWQQPIPFQSAPVDESQTDATAIPAAWQVRFLSLGVLTTPPSIQPPHVTVLERRGDTTEIQIAPAAPEVTFAQFQHPYASPLIIALPITAGSAPCRLLASLAQSELRVALRLENELAEAAAAFLRSARIEDAVDLMRSRSARELLFERRDDPLGAILGANVLLRMNPRPDADLTRWLEQVAAGFDWIPDTYALLGDIHSRYLQPELAFECYMRALERGLPIFTDSFSRLVSGMRRLTRPDARRQMGEERPTRAVAMFEELRAIGVDVDFSSVYLTLTSDANATRSAAATGWLPFPPKASPEASPPPPA